MASGTAYRCKNPRMGVLGFDSMPAARLYKAPPNKTSKTKPKPTTSIVDRLPLEILHLILLNVDLPSIGKLRRVDKTRRCLVESLTAYSLLRTHASDTLRIMDAAKRSLYFPIGRLFTEFCHPWCRTCGDFGPLLYLPTLTRSCYKYNYLRREYIVAPVADVCFHFGLTQKDLNPLPIIHNIEPPRSRLADIAQAKRPWGYSCMEATRQ